MNIGTKSVLFGAHQFLIHPLFVALAWWRLYGFPWDPRLWVAFFVHDLGYWGKPNMDGEEGEQHPMLGARIMGWLFDQRVGAVASLAAGFLREEAECLKDGHAIDGEWIIFDAADVEARHRYDCYYATAAALEAADYWHHFTLYHSRFMARRFDAQFSRLCVADKLATVLVPAWLYLLLTNLTGEIHEYMDIAHHQGGGKYAHEIRVLGSQREWFESMCTYMRGWVEEHRDCREDTWTPQPETVS